MNSDNEKIPDNPSAKDVARLAGVSLSTVSRVLSSVKSDIISEKTRAKVIKIANEIGYSPHPIARALRRKETRLIYLLVREISDPFFANLVDELSTQAHKLGYQIVLGNAHSDPQEALEISSVFDSRQCDGAIIIGDLRNDAEVLPKITDINRSTVALCRGRVMAGIPTINVDNEYGITKLWEHLREQGHKIIGFIDGGWLGDIQGRRRTFETLLEKFGVTGFVEADENNLDGGYRAMKRLLECNPRPTAVIGSEDIMAIGALRAAQDEGLMIPQDISIVGFDDIELSRFTCPRLTTVRQPVREMSILALDWLMKIIETHDICPEGTIIQITPEIILRESTGEVPQSDEKNG